jgi:Spy/CpxP family protein refolding chaperone
MRVTGLLLAAALIGTSAAAADKPDAKNPVNPGDKIICKSDTFVGSKIPKRVCLTRSQWEQGEQDGKDALDSQRRRYEKSLAPTGPN